MNLNEIRKRVIEEFDENKFDINDYFYIIDDPDLLISELLDINEKVDNFDVDFYVFCAWKSGNYYILVGDNLFKIKKEKIDKLKQYYEIRILASGTIEKVCLSEGICEDDVKSKYDQIGEYNETLLEEKDYDGEYSEIVRINKSKSRPKNFIFDEKKIIEYNNEKIMEEYYLNVNNTDKLVIHMSTTWKLENDENNSKIRYCLVQFLKNKYTPFAIVTQMEKLGNISFFNAQFYETYKDAKYYFMKKVN